jgi:hypothetical protein
MDDDKNRPAPAAGLQKRSESRIVWRDPEARTLRADLTEASLGREEISLTFGSGKPSAQDPKEVTAVLLARVVMTPFMAKRLAIALEEKLRRQEAAYGPIWPDSNGGKPPGAEKTSSERDLLLRLVNSLQIDLGAERSFKVFRNIILPNRFLLSTRKDAAPKEKVLDICRRLGLPDPFWAPLLQNLPDTRFVHFGFEENEKGSVYKVYLELNFKGRHYPFLVYLGFKWDPKDAARRAVARYTCYPSFTLKDIVEKVSLAFSGPDAGEAVEIAKGIVDAASRVAPGILYVDVTEDGNPRRSFDINTYDAALTLGAIRPLLVRMADHYRLPPEQFHTFIETIKTKRLGHLSGGIDREGRDFFTVHFSVEDR